MSCLSASLLWLMKPTLKYFNWNRIGSSVISVWSAKRHSNYLLSSVISIIYRCENVQIFIRCIWKSIIYRLAHSICVKPQTKTDLTGKNQQLQTVHRSSPWTSSRFAVDEVNSLLRFSLGGIAKVFHHRLHNNRLRCRIKAGESPSADEGTTFGHY